MAATITMTASYTTSRDITLADPLASFSMGFAPRFA